jgi:acyl-CoA synthetase (AMP-forming)/AMP-acid ligase II
LTAPTIYHRIAHWAEKTPEAPAILALHGKALSYKRLLCHIEDCALELRKLGIGRSDAVAIVLPNGPEMAAAFLAAASACTAAPLNPAYRADEFKFYLEDLKARAVITQPGASPALGEAVRSLGIRLIELAVQPGDPAGLFHFLGAAKAKGRQDTPARHQDTALILHTYGTTSRPKRVPLTHANLCASAENVGCALQLTAADRCLNIMPLFHIHGLVAALLSTLAAGASVICTPGFDAPNFFAWLADTRPTWYTAVPSMHQAILNRAGENRPVISRFPLRFIRSSSASLAPPVMAGLEQAFNVPVIEAYGMTEAAHQIASNPLPPRLRKPGSVGLPAGPQVAIMEENGGRFLPANVAGEIVLRGPNITSGYAGNPQANQSAFCGGWFRTGDQGYLDGDGYLFITGRLKEIINRGGEKISPREVDEVLLSHPLVLQAVTFAMPDPILGEEVATAVVLRQPEASEKDLRRFAAAHLADFKVPRRILILEDIPKGPTGKLQRIGLAEKLDLLPRTKPCTEGSLAPEWPCTPLERKLADLWSQVLKTGPVGLHQDFLDLGGDSLLAGRLAARIAQTFEIKVSLIDLLDAPTVYEQARWIEETILSEIEALPEEEANRLLGKGGEG